MTTPVSQPSVLRAKFGVQKRSSSLKLSCRTLNVYKEAFSAIDKNNEGFINKNQLKTVLSKLGQKPTDQEIEQMMGLESNEEGELQFHTFAKMMSARMPPEQQKDELREVFDVFDKDSNGMVSLAEIKAVLSEVYDENFDDLQDLIGMKCIDGRLDFNMFVKMMTGDKF